MLMFLENLKQKRYICNQDFIQNGSSQKQDRETYRRNK